MEKQSSVAAFSFGLDDHAPSPSSAPALSVAAAGAARSAEHVVVMADELNPASSTTATLVGSATVPPPAPSTGSGSALSTLMSAIGTTDSLQEESSGPHALINLKPRFVREEDGNVEEDDEEEFEDEEEYEDDEEGVDDEDDSDSDSDEDANELRDILGDVKNQTLDYLNPLRMWERATGNEIKLAHHLQPITDVASKVTEKLSGAVMDVSDAVVSGLQHGAQLAHTVAVDSPMARRLSAVESAAGADTTPSVLERKPSQRSIVRRKSNVGAAGPDATAGTLAPVADGTAAVASSGSTTVAIAATNGPRRIKRAPSQPPTESDAGQSHASTLVDGTTVGKKKKKRSVVLGPDGTPVGKTRVKQLISKVGDLGRKVVHLASDTVGMFYYDNTKNNFWGGSITCLDHRLFCSCVVYDEVRAATWLMFFSAVLCVIAFLVMDVVRTHACTHTHTHTLPLSFATFCVFRKFRIIRFQCS
jgi:hypothetical protein